MKIEATTSGDGLEIKVLLEGQEVAANLTEALRGWAGREAIMKAMLSASGPLAAELSRHVKIAIDDPSIAAKIRRATSEGLEAGLSAVRGAFMDSGRGAATKAFGRFISNAISRLRGELAEANAPLPITAGCFAIATTPARPRGALCLVESRGPSDDLPRWWVRFSDETLTGVARLVSEANLQRVEDPK